MEVNQGIRHLARDSAGDTATVRVITIFTLIYLPASFTAVSDSRDYIIIFPCVGLDTTSLTFFRPF